MTLLVPVVFRRSRLHGKCSGELINPYKHYAVRRLQGKNVQAIMEKLVKEKVEK